MDMTPQEIDSIEFTVNKVGGYNKTEVEAFMDRVSAALTELESQLRDAQERARRAEARLQDLVAGSSTPSPAESKAADEHTEELKRTLVLAQRTADAAIREAREEASRLVAEAQEAANQQVTAAHETSTSQLAAAQAEAERLVAEATQAAESARADAHSRLMGEIQSLEGTREELRSDVTLLDRHLEEQRQQLRGALAELARLIDDPKSFRIADAPAGREIHIPESVVSPPVVEEVAPEEVAPEEEAVAEPESPALAPEAEPEQAAASWEAPVEQLEQPEPQTDEAPVPPEVADAEAPAAYEADDAVEAAEPVALETEPGHEAFAPEPEAAVAEPELPGEGGVEAEWESLRDEPESIAAEVEAPPLAEPDAAYAPEPAHEMEPAMEAPAAAAEAPAPAPVDPGPPTQAVPTVVGDADEDAFLAELRKAMTDDEPLGPRDQNDADQRDLFGEATRRPRFGRRR